MSARWLMESGLRVILECLDTLAGVVVSPTATFQGIASRRPMVLALSAAVAVAVVSGLVLVPNPPELAEDLLDLPKGTISIWAALPVWVLFFMAVLSLQAAFVHLTAMILKAKGSYLGILCAFCFAYLPGLLAAPLVMLRAVLASERANAAYQIIFPLLCLWVFFLGMTAVQKNYDMTGARAASIACLAFTVLVVLPAVAAVVVMTRLMA